MIRLFYINNSKLQRQLRMQLGSPLTAFEVLISQYRTLTHLTQRQLKQLIRKFLSQKSSPNSNKQSLFQLLNSGKDRIVSLKRKLSQKFQQQYKLYDNVSKRMHHQYELKSNNECEKQEEQNLEIIQYLHSRCQFHIVKKLTESFQYQELVGVQTTLLNQADNIRKQIRMNYLTSLLSWMDKNHHHLQKINLIYFQLMICQYLNILCEGKSIQAILFLRKSIQSMRITQAQDKLISNMAYLSVAIEFNQPDLQFYLKLLEDAFIKAFTEIYQLTFQSSLEKKIALGISAKKTIHCSPTSKRKLHNCPICSEKVQHLSIKIPILTLQTSILKCRINQSIMDHENYPVCLPNGQIYSISGLKSTSLDNKYYCFSTNTWYDKQQAVKVYLT